MLVGVHTQEFEFEKDLNNVQNAVKRFGIEYPVALDSNYKTWLAYDNHYWPAHYLVDQQGIIRETHFGEGAYLETENAIRNLLGLPALSEQEKEEKGVMALRQLTPETYLGYERAAAYTPEINVIKDKIAQYDYKNKLDDNEVGLKGSWLVQSQYIQAKSDGALLSLNFMARHVYLVMQSPTPASVEILLDEKSIKQIPVNEARMYEIIDLTEGGRHIITLKFPKDVLVYAFTFGA